MQMQEDQYDSYKEFFEHAERLKDENINDLKKAILFTALPVLGVAVVISNSSNSTTYLWSLYISGICLIGAIFSVIASYWINVIYFSEPLDKAQKTTAWLFRIGLFFQVFATVLYVAGTISIAIFLHRNL